MTALQAYPVSSPGRGQVFQCLRKERQVLGSRARRSARQDKLKGWRGDGKHMIMVEDGEGPIVTLDMDVACIKDPAVVVFQYRQHDHMVQFAFRGHPLHVEIGRVSARL